jgi:ribosome-binding ATPase YchF (GTP1/OBG family)
VDDRERLESTASGAEVIKIADYEHYKTEPAVKEAGKMAVEGKEYVVADGDIMHFRFNV